MKLLLLADGFVGARIANFLIEHHTRDLALIVTTEDNDIYLTAKSKGIPACVFDTEDNVLSKLENAIDLGVLAWWPNLIKKPLLNVPRRGFINTHPSLLPYNRGKHYSFWALVEQAPFGVTLHCVDSGVDTGDIVAQTNLAYDWCDTGETLYTKAQAAMVDLFCNFYPTLRSEKYDTKPQNKGIGSFHRASEIETASKIDIDGLYSARDLLNLLRARTFEGFPGCWFDDGEHRFEISVKIRRVD
jgi:methionyl-tRNA formyltransferase